MIGLFTSPIWPLHWLTLPVFLPVFSAVLLILLHRRSIRLQRIVSGSSVALLLAVVVALLVSGAGNQHLVYPMGDWPAPFGIVWVYDRLAGLMLLLTAGLAAISFIYTVATDEDHRGPHFHALFQAQLFGLNGAFLTGDVFNLFVFFEVLLLASYGLMLHGGGARRSRAGLHYMVINLIGSTLFLFAVGALYGVLGTLNIADLAQKLGQAPVQDYGIIAAASLLLFVVFAIKAAAFPLYLWLPATYAETSAPVAALFAIMTKVGLYAMLRVHGTLFDAHTAPAAFVNLIGPWQIWLGILTLVMATLGVLAAQNLRRQVAYLILASVGTLMIALGMRTEAALSATLYYWIHTTVLSAGFFLLADMIRRGRTNGDDWAPAPPITRMVLLGSLFFVYALAMAGLPPLTGFVGKILILSAAVDQPLRTPIFATILITSLLAVIALARSGNRLFYRVDQPTTGVPLAAGPNRLGWIAVMSPIFVAVLMVIAANPLSSWLDQTSAQINATPDYIHAVLNPPTMNAGVLAFPAHPEHAATPTGAHQ
ncbi:MAG TPA: monovalent cation/H+ antiporter subunit D [Halothiobacillus sp.]|nr:monovalent cation/H+ antiporter subunit D [Halothiobacillus sp.]